MAYFGFRYHPVNTSHIPLGINKEHITKEVSFHFIPPETGKDKFIQLTTAE